MKKGPRPGMWEQAHTHSTKHDIRHTHLRGSLRLPLAHDKKRWRGQRVGWAQVRHTSPTSYFHISARLPLSRLVAG
jgi:hypothetical protein